MRDAEREGILRRDGGPDLHWKALAPKDAAADVVIVHGYGDHGGRYRSLAEHLLGEGIATWRVDLRGHGRSGGRRGDVERFDDYLTDLEGVIALARRNGPRPLFLLGHSHGGLVVLRHLLESKDASVAGAILSAPYLGLAFEPPRWKVALGDLLRHVVPSAPIPSGLDPSLLTSDPDKRRETEEDPLFFETATPRWFHWVRRIQADVLQRGGELHLPLLVLQPFADPVVAQAATEAFFGSVASDDKELVTFPEALHEVFSERPPIRERAEQVVAGWIRAHALVDRDRAPWQGG